MTPEETKVLRTRERRARRAAERQGMTLCRSRLRDPRALLYGTYMLVSRRTGAVVAGDHDAGYGLTLDQIEAALDQRVAS